MTLQIEMTLIACGRMNTSADNRRRAIFFYLFFFSLVARVAIRRAYQVDFRAGTREAVFSRSSGLPLFENSFTKLGKKMFFREAPELTVNQNFQHNSRQLSPIMLAFPWRPRKFSCTSRRSTGRPRRQRMPAA